MNLDLQSVAELDLFQITDPDPTKGPESGHIWIQPNHPDPYSTYELVRMEIEEKESSLIRYKTNQIQFYVQIGIQ